MMISGQPRLKSENAGGGEETEERRGGGDGKHEGC